MNNFLVTHIQQSKDRFDELRQANLPDWMFYLVYKGILHYLPVSPKKPDMKKIFSEVGLDFTDEQIFDMVEMLDVGIMHVDEIVQSKIDFRHDISQLKEHGKICDTDDGPRTTTKNIYEKP